jgi:hypothetical protein
MQLNKGKRGEKVGWTSYKKDPPLL